MNLPKGYRYARCCWTCKNLKDVGTYSGKCVLYDYIALIDYVCNDYDPEESMKLDA